MGQPINQLVDLKRLQEMNTCTECGSAPDPSALAVNNRSDDSSSSSDDSSDWGVGGDATDSEKAVPEHESGNTVVPYHITPSQIDC